MSALYVPFRQTRVDSVDFLLIMIIMALDHVREFWSVTPFRPEDLSQTTAALFFTRWITHLCAPVFAFLSGVSIYLQYERVNDRKTLSINLLKRGAWLILLQIFVLEFFMQLSFNFILLEVIWVLGWSMIVMAGLIWLPRWAIAIFAIAVIAGHDALPVIEPATLANLPLIILHNPPTFIPIEGFMPVLVSYTIIPWVGVMAAGFAIGKWFKLDPQLERYTFFNVGVSLLLFFAVLRWFNIYGDPFLWATHPRGDLFTVLSYINLNKYPASLLFLTLMLGIAFIILWLYSLLKNFIPKFINTYGEVPFFFYVLHLPLITGSSVVWVWLEFGELTNLSFITPNQYPPGYEPSLFRTYIVWIIVVAILYFPCKWFSQYKRRHRNFFTTYL
jgi:uncharacterized membrane protein